MFQNLCSTSNKNTFFAPFCVFVLSSTPFYVFYLKNMKTWNVTPLIWRGSNFFSFPNFIAPALDLMPCLQAWVTRDCNKGLKGLSMMKTMKIWKRIQRSMIFSIKSFMKTFKSCSKLIFFFGNKIFDQRFGANLKKSVLQNFCCKFLSFLAFLHKKCWSKYTTNTF